MLRSVTRKMATVSLVFALALPALPVAASEAADLISVCYPSASVVQQASSESDQAIQNHRIKVTLNNKAITVNYVTIASDAEVTASLAMAQTAIGQTEELSSLAARSSASAAINGGYFQSFDTSKPMDPYGILIKNGKVLHLGDTGSVLAFTTDGTVRMDNIQITLSGTADGEPFAIDALNHTPTQDSATVTLFSSSRGGSVGFNYGTNIIVQNGEVTKVQQNTDSQIPANGYVINIADSQEDLVARLQPAAKVAFATNISKRSGGAIDYSNVHTAIGAGPILVQDGTASVDPASEGFTDEKSFTLAASRSAVGITASGDIILAAGVSCTLEQMADIMIQLGAQDAISMNGGAASGLYANGETIVKPGCEISNALVFRAN